MSLGTQFGLQPTGFFPKATGDVTADLNAALQLAFGASINLTPQSRFGQLVGIFAERYAELWALALTVYASFDPNDATGVSLASLAALTGSLPVTPTPSTCAMTAVGTPGTVLATGRAVSVSGTGSLFQSTAPGTITAVSSYANGHNYLLADRVNTGGKVWQCTHPGLSSTPPTGAKGSTFTDGALTWLCLGSGTGAVDVPMSSELTGNVVAAAGALTGIQTPVAGWNDAYNVSPAVPGIAAESDADFRVRRVQELHGQGLSALDAVRSAVLKVPAVTTCTVFENVTDATNSDGMPPHSVEVMVQGGDPLAVCTAIFQSVAAGIATTGNQSPQTVTDSQGHAHSVLFSRPTLVPIWVTFNMVVDPTAFPVSGVAQALANLLGYGNGLVPDYDVIGTQLAAAVLNGVPAQGLEGVPGVLDPGLPLIGTSNPPTTTTTVPISSRQIATISAGYVVINTTNGSP